MSQTPAPWRDALLPFAAPLRLLAWVFLVSGVLPALAAIPDLIAAPGAAAPPLAGGLALLALAAALLLRPAPADVAQGMFRTLAAALAAGLGGMLTLFAAVAA